MRIFRAVKCAQTEEQLQTILKIAETMGARGLEVQEIEGLMAERTPERRAETLIKHCKNAISSIAYHMPLLPWHSDIEVLKKYDLCSDDSCHLFQLVKETIKEAALVGNELDLQNEIPIVVHLFGFVEHDKITEEERQRKIGIGEKKLVELQEFANEESRDFGLTKNGESLLKLVRENNSPGTVDGIVDFHPYDIARTAKDGIGTVLDFSHIFQFLLYSHKNMGEFPGVDLSVKLYRADLSWDSIINTLKPSLRLLHMNDATDYRRITEGIEIGKGSFPHKLVIPLICKSLSHDIIGTYEIKNGHTDPEAMLRSDGRYRKLFGNRFFEYFY